MGVCGIRPLPEPNADYSDSLLELAMGKWALTLVESPTHLRLADACAASGSVTVGQPQ
jgi:hypothetical protein